MNAILSLFPQSEFSLLSVVIGMPLLGAFVNGIWGKRLGKDAVRMMALIAMGVSFAAALVTFAALNSVVDASAIKDGDHIRHEHAKLVWDAWDWMYVSSKNAGTIPIGVKFSVDALSGVMMLVVTGVGFLIHLYATEYMKEDAAFWRFFAYLNLFVFSMLVLILGDNLPLLFVGWEGVGLCSYLLIGFWYGKMPNATAGKKAFIANRIGDFGLICAMGLLAYYTGALDWDGIARNADALLTPNEAQQVHLWPIGGGRFDGALKFLQPANAITITAATAVCLMLLLGATGKSAQLPLYVWLPDAMAGPTPVSALIHAATMVTAGIYLVCRMSFVFVLSPWTMAIIAIVGALTALLAATIALVQNDIKKVLAYSTVSQLGFMFLGVGTGAFVAGFFHVFTHAFFKACLFLGAGSVIHAMHARIHDDDKSQDMRNMGGLHKYMPWTFRTFAVSTAAIIGFPLTSGFFSKDEILFKAMTNRYALVSPERMKHITLPPEWLHKGLYFAGLAAATMTAFYMCRLLFLTFFGDFRGWTVGRPSQLAMKAHGHDTHGAHDSHEHHEDLSEPGHAPHESPLSMTVPLIILAAFAAFAGFLNPGLLKHWLPLPMEHWLDPVFAEVVEKAIKPMEHAESLEWMCTLGAFAAFAIGSGLAYWVYIVNKGEPAKQWAASFPNLHKWAMDKWRVDEFYDYTLLQGVDALAETAEATDRIAVDGLLAKVTSGIVTALGVILRAMQTGVVHVYAGAMVVGLAVFGWFFAMPHVDYQTIDKGDGVYEITAAPGMGYGYMWVEDPSKAPEKPRFDGRSTYTVKVNDGESKTIELRVINAFKLVKTKSIPVSRPKPKTEEKKSEKLGMNTL